MRRMSAMVMPLNVLRLRRYVKRHNAQATLSQPLFTEENQSFKEPPNVGFKDCR